MVAHADSSKKQLISIVVPCYNEGDVFPELQASLLAISKSWESRYDTEFVLVDDGSRDSTWAQMEKFAASDARVIAVTLSRNFGHQIALTCGYDLAKGDVLISMDGDLQDPPSAIPEMIAEWEKGADIVLAVRRSRPGESQFKRWSAKWFYRLFNFLGKISVPADSGDFRLMNRASVDALCSLREKHRYIRGMVGWLGFRTAEILYDREPRKAGTSKYPLFKMFGLAMDALISFSTVPLRMAYLFSACASSLILIYILYVLVQHLFYDEMLVRGWTSLLLSIVIFGFLNLLCLGLMGEYIGRIYESAQNRPLYFIRERKKK